MVIIEVPIPARMSKRLFISSSGTGLEKSSNSLQYVQARLQRRLGMICTKIGCLVDASALPIMRNSRKRVRANRRLLRMRTAAEGCATLLLPAIQNERCPSLNYTLACYTASTPVPAYYCWWRIRYLGSKWSRKPDEPPAYPQFTAGPFASHGVAGFRLHCRATRSQKLDGGSQPGHGSDLRCCGDSGAHSSGLGRVFYPHAVATEPATVGFAIQAFRPRDRRNS